MLIITVTVDSGKDNIIGIKEDLAMMCEKFGDVKRIEVKTTTPQPEQMNISDYRR